MRTFILLSLVAFLSCEPVRGGVVLSTGTIDFNEAAFVSAFGTASNSNFVVSEGGLTSRVVMADLWDNSTGAIHGAGMSDSADIRFSFSTSLLPRAAGSGNTGTSLGPGNSDLSIRYDSSSNHRFTSNHAFNSSNDVGDVWRTSMRMDFLDTLTFTAADLQNFRFTSMNTASSSAWEYSYVGFLNENGNLFAPEAVETWNGAQQDAPDGWAVANDRSTIKPETVSISTDQNGSGTQVEIQEIELAPRNSDFLTGGSYTLSFEGESTTIQHDATAADIQTALNALATITGAGGVTVAADGDHFLVTFDDAGNQDRLVVDADDLVTADSYPFSGRLDSGSNGTFNTLTVDPDSLGGISSSTRITGLIWNSYVEAINDTSGSFSLTSSFTSFDVNGGTIQAVPEPSSVAFCVLFAGGFGYSRLRKRA